MDSGTRNSGKLFDRMPPCLSNQETPRRLGSRTAMGLGAGTSGEAFDETPRKKSKLETDAAVLSWASLPSDILGVVLSLLPCFADRANVGAVCHHWRSQILQDLHPPLPLLVLPKFKFWCLCSGVPNRAAWSVQMPQEAAAGDVRCVGSFQEWLVCVAPVRDRGTQYRKFDGECFMVNASSHKVVRLPHLSTFTHGLSGYSHKALPVIPVDTGLGVVYFTTGDKYTMSLRKVALSASPDSGSKCIAVASSYHGLTQTLALWQPGMNSWHVCNGLPIVGPKDLAFYQGKLYVLSRFVPRLYTFELEEDGRGVVVSRVKHYVIDTLRNHHIQRCGELIYNIVVWRDNLLLITRRYHTTADTYSPKREVRQVQVFVLNFGTNTCGLTEIHNFDGDCVFVDSCGCNSFPAGLHGDEGDLVYFVDQYRKYDISNFNPSYDTFVYNVRNGTTRPFSVELSPNNFGAPNGKLDVPVWLLTSK
ncbi:unnamed protein product [Urochloa decumbens]|uniref:DUF295 domain-containing protein n=1 Tax=Urochloa decumbens TaxID=240449 RepID=A0ABC9APU2_9POAL